MHARYYSPNLGRFATVDPVGGDIGSSQRWNRYAYSLGNPMRFLDPDGKDEVEFGDRRFEIFPGELFVVMQSNGGVHTTTFVGGGAPSEFVVVDNTSARNQNLEAFGDRVRERLPENTGNVHLPNNLVIATVNGQPNVNSPANGAVAVGVIPIRNGGPVSGDHVVQAAATIEMFHQDASLKQCTDFSLELGEVLGVEYDLQYQLFEDRSSTEVFVRSVDLTRELSK